MCMLPMDIDQCNLATVTIFVIFGDMKTLHVTHCDIRLHENITRNTL